MSLDGEQAYVLNKNYTDQKISIPDKTDYLFNKYLDVVYESCDRDINVFTSALDIKTDSGHEWENLPLRDGDDPQLNYSTNGYLRFYSGSSNFEHPLSPVLIKDFLDATPYLKFRMHHSSTHTWERVFYVKYIDELNWILLSAGATVISIKKCIGGTVTTVASSSTASNVSVYHSSISKFDVFFKIVHPNKASSGRSLYVKRDDGKELVYDIPDTDWDVLGGLGKVGFGARAWTNLYGFMAGRTHI